MFNSKNLDVRLLAQNFVDSLDYSEAVLTSFNDYHTEGVRLVTLFRSDRLKVKLFFFNGVKPNEEGFVVNPHTHTFNFHSHVLKGTIRNVVHSEDPKDGEEWRKYWYQSNEGTPIQHYAGMVRLNEQYAERVDAGESFYLTHDQIHSIKPRGDSIMLVFQYKSTPVPFTRTYQKKDTPVRQYDVKPMSVDQIKSALVEAGFKV